MFNDTNKMNKLPILKKIRIPKWKCENGTKDTLMNHPVKTKIRKHIAISVKKYGSYFGLFGEGEDYTLIKKIAPNAKVIMLDNGRGFNNLAKLRELVKQIPELIIGNYKKFAKKGEHTFAVIWLDFCGQMSRMLLEHIDLTPRIMQGKGELYITIMETRDSYFPEWMTRDERRKRTIELIQDHLSAKGVQTKIIYQERYGSVPMHKDRKTMRETPMWTVGLAYEKI